ncbi:MAG: hypothetical protein ACI8UO_004420, partial [Verrucomicrobiales bacterium]
VEQHKPIGYVLENLLSKNFVGGVHESHSDARLEFVSFTRKSAKLNHR